jgi:hypothetical protein
MPAIKPRDVTFLDLRNSILCSECELISYNNTSRCLACGSSAVLSLARVLGGSLRGEPTVRVLAAEPLKRAIAMPPCPAPAHLAAAEGAPHMPGFGRCGSVPIAVPAAEAAGVTPVHFAMKLVVERAYRLSRSGGAAIAARRDGRMLCEARMGDMAPSLGAEVRTGLSAMSLSTRRTLRCDLAAADSRVDAAHCRAAGVNSVVAAPITNLNRVLGVVTVLSPQPYSFQDRDVAIMQWLADVMAVVFTSTRADLSFGTQSTTRGELISEA